MYFTHTMYFTQASSMRERCVTPADSNPSLVFAGSVQSVRTMTSALCVTMGTNII